MATTWLTEMGNSASTASCCPRSQIMKNRTWLTLLPLACMWMFAWGHVSTADATSWMLFIAVVLLGADVVARRGGAGAGV